MVISLLSDEDDKSPFKCLIPTSPIVISDSPLAIQYVGGLRNTVEIDLNQQSDTLPSPLFCSKNKDKLTTDSSIEQGNLKVELSESLGQTDLIIEPSQPVRQSREKIQISHSMYDLLCQSPEFNSLFDSVSWSFSEHPERIFASGSKIILLVLTFEEFVRMNPPFQTSTITPTHLYIKDRTKYLQQINIQRQRNFKKAVITTQPIDEINKEFTAIELFENRLLEFELFGGKLVIFYSEIVGDLMEVIQRLINDEIELASNNVQVIRRGGGKGKVDPDNFTAIWKCWLTELLGVSDEMAQEIVYHIPTLTSALHYLAKDGSEQFANRIARIKYKERNISNKIAQRIVKMLSSDSGTEALFQD